MATTKKAAKSKFIAEDEFLNETSSQHVSPKCKKTGKRENIDMSDFIRQIAKSKKKKIEMAQEDNKVCRQKVLNGMNHQLEERKKGDSKFLKSLTDLLSQLETDYNAIKESEQNAERLTDAVMKFIRQTSAAHKQKLKSLKDIVTGFKEQQEEMQTQQQAETERLAEELEKDINEMQEKLIAETRRNGWEAMRRSIFHAMQNDF